MNYLLMVDDTPGALNAAWQQYEFWSENRIISRQPIALTNVAICETALGRSSQLSSGLNGC